MSTGLIVAIVVVALVLLALLVLRPRTRAARERELARRRGVAAERHRGEAERRERDAARLETEAGAARAEAQAHEEHASLHERGMADDTLVEQDENDLARHVEQRTGGRLVTDSGGGTRAVGPDERAGSEGEPGRFARTSEAEERERERADAAAAEERRFARSEGTDAATPDRPAAVQSDEPRP